MKSIQILALSLLAIAPLSAAPISSLPNLNTIFVIEVTGVATSHNFLPFGAVEQVGNVPPDIATNGNEQYDLFYSDANGTFNQNGEYLTITCNFEQFGFTGCNIAAVGLTFAGGPNVLFNTITALSTGFSYVAGSENLIIDNDLATFSSLGNNADGNPPLRVTLGITAPSGSEVPEPSTYATLGAGLLVAAFLRRHNG